MHQVRTVRPHQVAAPPAGPTTIELSRDEREQLRVVRHHAYERHQRNAAWMRELLQWDASRASTTTTNAAVENGGADQQLQSDEIEALRKKLADQQQQLADEQERHAELLHALRAIDSDNALAVCRARVLEATARHAHATHKEPKVIRL